MIKNVFLDLDDTILDFHRGEREAISKTLLHFGVEPTEGVIATYRAFNRSCWEALERGEMTREEVLIRRFELFFSEVGKTCDPHEVQSFYERRLSEGCYFLDGAERLLSTLFERYDLYITSNGTAFVQDRRIEASGIKRYFKGIFISERIGFNKPSREFFDGCFASVDCPERDMTVIVGDSLTSDILGGINAGIHTVHFNPSGKTEYSSIIPAYSAASLDEIPEILGKI